MSRVKTTQIRSDQIPAPISAWETCEIQYEALYDNYRRLSWIPFPRQNQFRFVAYTSSPNGRYCVGKTEPFETWMAYPDIDQNTCAIINGFVEKLAKEGWQEVDEGTNRCWFMRQFRRHL